MRVAHTGETFAYHSTQHLRNVRRLLATLQQLTRERPDYRPSIPELAELTGLSREGLLAALDTLRDDYGYVTQGTANGRAADRSIRLVETTY